MKNAEREQRRKRRCDWMEAAQKGDAEAYRSLLDDIGPDLLRFLRARIADQGQVEDVYQETMIAIHRARHTYLVSRPVEPWMYAIASHVMSRQMRRHRRRALRERPVEPSMHVAVPDDSYARLDFARAFGRLTPPQRQALELLKIEGFSTEAAAARAGVSPVAFRVRAHRAYKALRRLLGS